MSTSCRHEHRRIDPIPQGGAVVVCMDCGEFWDIDIEQPPPHAPERPLGSGHDSDLPKDKDDDTG